MRTILLLALVLLLGACAPGVASWVDQDDWAPAAEDAQVGRPVIEYPMRPTPPAPPAPERPEDGRGRPDWAPGPPPWAPGPPPHAGPPTWAPGPPPWAGQPGGRP